MKGDFTRFTHDPAKHYTRVLKQQGRVALDSDWNEYVAIRSYLERTEAVDVIGCCGVPQQEGGFEIQPATETQDGFEVTSERGEILVLTPGRIYVNGLLCENPPVGEDTDGTARRLTDQEQHSTFELPEEPGLYVAYLDVWQRHVTALDDEEIREVALGGPDTTTRLQTVWQVKMEPYEEAPARDDEDVECPPCNWKSRTGEPRLRAWADPAEREEDLCEIPEAGGYRGIENRLYRVEVHEGTDRGATGTATFKWSRDNAAVVYTVNSIDPSKPFLTVEEQPRDETLALDEGQWVELTCEEWEFEQRPGMLSEVEDVRTVAGPGPTRLQRIDLVPGTTDGRLGTLHSKLEASEEAHVTVRRWDQNPEDGGAVSINPGEEIELEEGIFVQFEDRGSTTYKTGDYWTIPARAVIEDVLWPTRNGDSRGSDPDRALFRKREGIAHHFCPLALVRVDSTDEGGVTLRKHRDCRRTFPPLIETGREGCCRTVAPDEDLQQVVHEVIEAGGGCISLCQGVHRVDAPLALHEARNLTIRGEGEATVLHLVDDSDEPAGGIVLRGCRDVTLAEMLLVGDPRLPAVVTSAAGRQALETRDLAFEDVTVVHRALGETRQARWERAFVEGPSASEGRAMEIDDGDIDTSQTTAIVGTVTDASTGEPLVGANVVIPSLDLGAATNAEGEYEITQVPPGHYQLKVSFVGYETTVVQDVTVHVDETTRLNVELSPATDGGDGGDEEGTVPALASAVRLANMSGVRIEHSELLAPVGIRALWGHELPDVAPLSDEDEGLGTAKTIDFGDLETGREYEIGEQIQTEEATFSVSESEVGSLIGIGEETARVEERDGRIGLVCEEARLDLSFVENFQGPAHGLTIRVSNQEQISHELRVNGESELLHGPPGSESNGVVDFDGDTIEGVEVSAWQAEDGFGQVLSFSGSVRSVGLCGQDLFIHNYQFRVPSEEELTTEPVDYGTGVRDLDVRDSEIRFTDFGIFSCRSERWTLENSTVAWLSPSQRDIFNVSEDLDAVRDDSWREDTLDLPTSPTSPEVPSSGSAVKSLLWRDCRIEDCLLTGDRGVDLWWQIRGSIESNTLRTESRGLHAFWVYDADWERNALALTAGTAITVGGSVRTRIDENRIEGRCGLVNVSLASMGRDLLIFVDDIRESYGLPSRRESSRRVLWLILEEAVRLLGMRRIVRWVKRLAKLIYARNGLVDGEGGWHHRLIVQPVMYVAARYLLPVLRRWVQQGGGELRAADARLFPIVALEVQDNRMECERHAIALEGFLTAGGIDLAHNHLHAGTADVQGQAILLNASPYSVNVHLVNAGLQRVVDAAEREGWDLSDELSRFSADNRIRGNTVTSINTAIESNLFDLDVVDNHVTLQPRPVSHATVEDGLRKVEEEEEMVPLVQSVRLGETGMQQSLRDKYGRQAPSRKQGPCGPAGRMPGSNEFNEAVTGYKTSYKEAEEQGDQHQAANALTKLLDVFVGVTNTHGIWVKAPGARIEGNHVLVPPELEREKQARGGVRLEGERSIIQLVMSAVLLGESPLLGVTESVVSSNEIMGGIGRGIDVRDLFVVEEMFQRVQAKRSSLSETFSEQSFGDRQSHPVSLRANEIRGLLDGGIVVDSPSLLRDLEIVENTLVDCGRPPVEDTAESEDSFGFSTQPYGGVYAADVARCRLHGNRIVDSPSGVFAVELERIDLIVMTDNTLRGKGRVVSFDEQDGSQQESIYIPPALGRLVVEEHLTVSSNLFEPEDPSLIPLWIRIKEDGRGTITNNTSTGAWPILVDTQNIQSGFNHPQL